MRRKHKKGDDRPKPKKFCDPGVCDCCLYVGEGDFLCDKHMEIVVSDWEPTANYLMCQNRDRSGGADGKKLKIQRVSAGFLGQVIERRIPCGLFLTREGRKWVAVDNSTRDAWTEEFSRKRQAIRWLRGKFEVS